MSMGEFIGEMLIGILISYTSYQIGWKSNLNFLHRYHWNKVAEGDLKPFAKKMGLGGLVAGLSIFFMPLVNWLTGAQFGYYLGLAGIVIGVVMMLYTVLHYNGTPFGRAAK